MLQLNTINIFIYLEQKYNIFIEIGQILSELYNILRKKILQNRNEISFNMHFKRIRSERLSREKFTKLFANFESVVFIQINNIGIRVLTSLIFFANR